MLKDIILGKNNILSLAFYKLLYFLGACLASSIIGGIWVGNSYEGIYTHTVGGVFLSSCWRVLFIWLLLLLPWEAIRSQIALALAVQSLKEQEEENKSLRKSGGKYPVLPQATEAPNYLQSGVLDLGTFTGHDIDPQIDIDKFTLREEIGYRAPSPYALSRKEQAILLHLQRKQATYSPPLSSRAAYK